MRNGKGLVQVCLTRNPAHFPDGRGAPSARKTPVSAASAGLVLFDDHEPGMYALTLLHDENRNGRLDTIMGIPKEGFGFSRNPVIRFGPPRFEQVRFPLDGHTGHQAVRMKYLL